MFGVPDWLKRRWEAGEDRDRLPLGDDSHDPLIRELVPWVAEVTPWEAVEAFKERARTAAGRIGPDGLARLVQHRSYPFPETEAWKRGKEFRFVQEWPQACENAVFEIAYQIADDRPARLWALLAPEGEAESPAEESRAVIDRRTADAIAQNYVRAKGPAHDEQDDDEMVVVQDWTIETASGWVYACATRRWLRGEETETILGNAPFLVPRDGGEVFQFDSARTVEWYLRGYEAGFRWWAGDLTITRVFDRERTALFLEDLRVDYVVPEFAYGVEWRIPQLYTPEEIRTLLGSPPVTFHRVGVMNEYETYLEMRASGCCLFHIGPPRDEQDGEGDAPVP